MFAGFNLQTTDGFRGYQSTGEALFCAHKRQVQQAIDKLMLSDGSINGSEMQNNWFPQIQSSVFISHSHADQESAIGLAGWLKSEFDLDSFIDSCVWGYADDLLQTIDDTFCKSGDGNAYSYELRNQSTSHVHMMLATALTMMIDKTESIFFLNSPNSIKPGDVIDKTHSPWIYHEIGMTNLVRRRSREAHRQSLIKKAFILDSVNINYDVRLDHLVPLSNSDLTRWSLHYPETPSLHALDYLYLLNGIVDRPTSD